MSPEIAADGFFRMRVCRKLEMRRKALLVYPPEKKF